MRGSLLLSGPALRCQLGTQRLYRGLYGCLPALPILLSLPCKSGVGWAAAAGMGHAAFIDPRDWIIDYMPRAYAESMPPVGLTNPGLWNPRNDEWDRYLTDKKKHATRDEYRHLLCFGLFTAAAHAALTDAVATLRAKNATARDTADANDLLDSAIRTIATCGQAAEDRLTYHSRFKCKKALVTGEERVVEGLVYSRFFDTTAAERSSNGVDGLLNALDDKKTRDKLNRLSRQATRLIGRATRNARWLPWWASVPSQANGKPIHRPVETAYQHTDSSGYGDDWQLDPLMFAELESRFGPHSIDRFASALNTLLPRYNAAWLDPTCEAVDSLHLPDADWRRENNWCNASWTLRHDLVQKLRQSGAAATVIAPRWEGKAWQQALTEMAVEELTVAPRAGLFRPGRRDGRALYLSAVNNFFKDHGREPMAMGDLVSRVRKGLAASQVTLNRADAGRPIARARGAESLDPGKSPMPGAGTYLGHGPKYRDASKKLLCQLPVSTHADIAELLHYFDAARQVFAGGRVLAARWAIRRREGHAKWTADTLTSWGATTAAYVIGVTMQKIKYFGGWAMESSVVLDYIDPTVLPCPAALHLFGWMTPWGGQPARLPRQVAT
eukprot:jgi/Tetstr1/422464/TSEL_013302.t1